VERKAAICRKIEKMILHNTLKLALIIWSFELLFGGVHGQRSRGRPKKRWVDVIKNYCQEMGLTICEATRATMDREKWYKLMGGLLLCAEASPRH